MSNRRTWLLAAVAAAAAGAGLALSRQRNDPSTGQGAAPPASAPPGAPPSSAASSSPPSSGPAAGPASSGSTPGTAASPASAAADTGAATATAINQLFAMELTGPDGEPMPMSQFRNSRLVVNFWATWCPPCVEEMPELSAMAREFAGQGVRFVGIAIDQQPNVAKFLQKLPVDYPIAIAGAAGLAIIGPLGNPQGGLPFTVVLDVDGTVRERYLGKVEMSALRQVLTS